MEKCFNKCFNKTKKQSFKILKTNSLKLCLSGVGGVRTLVQTTYSNVFYMLSF